MDRAVKRGFAIGVAVVAALAGAAYSLQPGVRVAQNAMHVALPADLVPAPPKAQPPRAAEAPSQTLPSPSDSGVEGASVAPGAEIGAPATSGAAPSSAPAIALAPRQDPPPAAAHRSLPADMSRAAIPAQVAPNDVATGSAFDIVRVEPSGEMVVAGRCAQSCSAELLANGKPHDSAAADAQGHWTMAPAPLPPGDYQLSLRTRSGDGETRLSAQSLTVVIPDPPSKDVVVVLNAPDAPARILQQPEPSPAAAPAIVAMAPSGPAAVPGAIRPAETTTPGAARSSAPPLAIAAVEAENGRFYVQGTGQTNALLRLYLNNAPVAGAVIGQEGRWSLRVERGLAPGAYVMRADQLDAAGAKVIGRVEATFTYAPQVADAMASANPADPPRPSPSAKASPAAGSTRVRRAPRDDGTAGRIVGAAPAAASSADAANPVIASVDTATVQRGDSLWRISRATYGRGVRYTVIYRANDGQIRNPALIYPGQLLVLPADEARAEVVLPRP